MARRVERFGRLDAAANVAGTHAGLGALTAEVHRGGLRHPDPGEPARHVAMCPRGAAPNGLAGLGLDREHVVGERPDGRGARGRLLGRQARDPRLTRTAAVEYAEHGIRVNAICPGLVDTPLTERALAIGRRRSGRRSGGGRARDIPAGRMATAEEIGECAAWLCLDSSRVSHGATITVDGGMTVGASARARAADLDLRRGRQRPAAAGAHRRDDARGAGARGDVAGGVRLRGRRRRARARRCGRTGRRSTGGGSCRACCATCRSATRASSCSAARCRRRS